jgi:hypothetical protein
LAYRGEDEQGNTNVTVGLAFLGLTCLAIVGAV